MVIWEFRSFVINDSKQGTGESWNRRRSTEKKGRKAYSCPDFNGATWWYFRIRDGCPQKVSVQQIWHLHLPNSKCNTFFYHKVKHKLSPTNLRIKTASDNSCSSLSPSRAERCTLVCEWNFHSTVCKLAADNKQTLSRDFLKCCQPVVIWEFDMLSPP